MSSPAGSQAAAGRRPWGSTSARGPRQLEQDRGWGVVLDISFPLLSRAAPKWMGGPPSWLCVGGGVVSLGVEEGVSHAQR